MERVSRVETDGQQALSLGMMANLGAFTFSAPNLGIISAELNGAPGSITWAAIVYVLMQGIGSKLIIPVTYQPVEIDLGEQIP